MRKMILTLGLGLVVSQAAVAASIGETSVTGGAVKGVVNGSVAKYLGIPYAAPPVGENRWRVPQPVKAWPGVRTADHFSPACFQATSPRLRDVSEDCLYLNVWTPAQSKSERLPVLFWAYGGGFQSGAGSNPMYDGEALAKKGIIVVNFNFRMGALGFLAHPELTAESPAHSSGNYGMHDTIAALKWVRANIAAFGGDPNAITVAGQSSGAGQIKILDISPLTRGMYARAIIQSGPRIGAAGPTLKEGEEQGVKFAKSLGAGSIADLRALSPEKILAGSENFRFAPITDGQVMPATPIEMIKRGEFNKTPILGGQTADEQSGRNPKANQFTAQECLDYVDKHTGSWAPQFKKAYFNPPSANCFDEIRIMGRDRNLLTNFEWAKIRLAQSNAPIYTYVFTHAQPGPDAERQRAFHGVELPYVFNTLDKLPGNRPFTQTDRDIADKVSSYWANFVKTGNPNGPGLPTWPAVDPKKPQTMELGEKFGPRPLVGGERGKLLDQYLAAEGPKTLSEGALPFSR